MPILRGPIYRIQDKDGRGPWRPGLSAQWITADKDTPNLPPAVQEECPNFFDIVSKEHSLGRYVGCGVRGFSGVTKWFLTAELARLHDMGFNLVVANLATVLWESDNQVLFSSHKPLSRLPVRSWRFSLEDAA